MLLSAHFVACKALALEDAKYVARICAPGSKQKVLHSNYYKVVLVRRDLRRALDLDFDDSQCSMHFLHDCGGLKLLGQRLRAQEEAKMYLSPIIAK